MRKTTAYNAVPKKTASLSREKLYFLFTEELKRRYWGEKQLLELLPALSKTATSYELIIAIGSHEKVTLHQIDRLLHIFDALGERALGSRYEIMEDLLARAADSASHQIGFNRDSAIITACRNIMSHEISIYENLIFYANALDEKKASGYLNMAASEERSARAQFSEIVLSEIYFDKVG